MQKSAHFFAGANTAAGFVNYFSDIIKKKNCRHMYYIKGGPGVGKSTLMKRMGEVYEREFPDSVVTYFHCSGDPESLDGLILEEENGCIGMIDATAPHTFDPPIPGAHDTLVSLGDCLNEKRMHTYAPFLHSLNVEISESYQRCYAYLRAAGALYDIENKEYTTLKRWDKGELKTFIMRMIEEQFELSSHPLAESGIRNYFIEAYTHRGQVDFLDQLPRENTIVFHCPTEGHLSGLLAYTMELLTSFGIEVIALHHPLCAEYLSHLYCPQEKLLLTGNKRLGTAVEVDGLLEKTYYHKYRNGLYDPGLSQKLIEGAVNQLKHAKMMHDELEAIYIEHMDFQKWEEKFAGILDK